MNSKSFVLLVACALSGCQPAVADKLSDAQFEAMDANRDGRLSRKEQTAAVRRMFEAMDADGDGKVTPAEMRAAQRSSNGGRTPANGGLSAEEKISAVDADGDGTLSAAEHEAGARMMFEKMDRNKDRFLSRTEFAAGHIQLLRRTAERSHLRGA